MDWKIIETNQLAPQDIDRQGNKLLIGNGYIGYRGTLEEYHQRPENRHHRLRAVRQGRRPVARTDQPAQRLFCPGDLPGRTAACR